MEVRLQDVRHALTYIIFLYVPQTYTVWDEDPLQLVKQFITQLHKQVLILGWICDPVHSWRLSKDTDQHLQVFVAAMYLASCGLQLLSCVTVRLGVGVASVNGLDGMEEALLLWWRPERPSLVQTLEGAGTDHISLRTTFGNDWENQHWVQFLTTGTEVAELAMAQAPGVPHLGGPYMPGLASTRLVTQGPLCSRSWVSASPEVVQTRNGSVTAGMVKTSAAGGSARTESWISRQAGPWLAATTWPTA